MSGARVIGRNLIQIDSGRVLGPHGSAPPFRCGACARGVNEDASHDLRGQSEEMRAILPVDVVGVDQTEIGLMDERRALQRQARAFVPHVPPGLDSQLRVDQRRELLERPLVSLAPCLQQARYVDGLGRGHATL